MSSKRLYLFIAVFFCFYGQVKGASVEVELACNNDFQKLIDESLDASDKKSFRSARVELHRIWTRYQELKMECNTTKCKEILSSTIFDDEMNPERFDSSTGLAKSVAQDVSILGKALKKARSKQKNQRLARDLERIVKEAEITPDGKFAKTLEMAYLKDSFFDEPRGYSNLIQLTADFGRNRMFGQQTYLTFLENGLRSFAKEERRIEEVFISPNPNLESEFFQKYGKNLSEKEMAAAVEMKKLIVSARKATVDLSSSLHTVRDFVYALRLVDPSCVDKALDAVEKYQIEAHAQKIMGSAPGKE